MDGISCPWFLLSARHDHPRSVHVLRHGIWKARMTSQSVLSSPSVADGVDMWHHGNPGTRDTRDTAPVSIWGICTVVVSKPRFKRSIVALLADNGSRMTSVACRAILRTPGLLFLLKCSRSRMSGCLALQSPCLRSDGAIMIRLESQGPCLRHRSYVGPCAVHALSLVHAYVRHWQGCADQQPAPRRTTRRVF